MNHNPFFEVFDNGVVRIALIGALGILSLFLLAQTITMAANFGRPGVPATDTVTVSGQGQATLPPDVAQVSFTVENIASSVSEAQALTTKQANAAIAYLKEQNIADKDVKTLSYTIYPQYSSPCPPYDRTCPSDTRAPAPKITGYQVAETIQVTVRDLTTVGTLIGGLGKLEVQNLNGPAFALDDPTAGYDAARADAIAKAKAQADRLAEQLGVRLGKVVNFSESSGGRNYPMYEYGMGGAADSKAVSAPSLPVGENTYSASVSITYEIR